MPINSKSRSFILSFTIFILVYTTAVLFFCRILYSPAAKDSDLPIEQSSLRTVIIDAGHGGEDGGATGVNGALEKDLNLIIAKKLYDELSSVGIRCVMTRSTDMLLYDREENYEGRKKALDMQARLDIAAKYPDAIFVSIHQNSFSAEKYRGFQAYYSTNDSRSCILAQNIESCVKNSLQPSNNRVSKASSGNIYLLEKLQCPAVLLECGFISNAEECDLLCDESYQKRLCETFCDAIVDFLNQYNK